MSKYKNVRTEVDGITFDSKKEATRYVELKMLEKAGIITDLVLQPRYPVRINDIKVFEYRGDFEYWEGGEKKIEDCKGFRTQIYKLKKKCVEAYYGIEIIET